MPVHREMYIYIYIYIHADVVKTNGCLRLSGIANYRHGHRRIYLVRSFLPVSFVHATSLFSFRDDQINRIDPSSLMVQFHIRIESRKGNRRKSYVATCVKREIRGAGFTIPFHKI